MKRIFKYEIPMRLSYMGASWEPRTNVKLPQGARILTTQAQNNVPVLWAEVDPEAPLEDRELLIAATGEDLPADVERTYIGTIQLAQGNLIFHIYEEKS